MNEPPDCLKIITAYVLACCTVNGTGLRTVSRELLTNIAIKSVSGRGFRATLIVGI